MRTEEASLDEISLIIFFLKIIRRTQLSHGAVHLIPIGNGEHIQATQAHIPIQIPKVCEIPSLYLRL